MHNNSNFYKSIYTYLCISGIAVLMLSYLLPIHTTPIPTLEIEVCATIGLIILSLTFFIKLQNKDNFIPKTIILPCSLILVALYHLYRYQNFYSIKMINIMVIGYLICLLIAICTAYHFKQQNFDLLKFLSIGFVVVGMLSSIIMLCQVFTLGESINKFTQPIWSFLHLERLISVPLNTTNLRPYANINQPNHILTIISWAIVSWIYLGARCINKLNYKVNLIKTSIFFVIGLLLALGLVLPASRSLYLHGFKYVVILALYFRHNPKYAITIFLFLAISIIVSLNAVSWAKYNYHLPIATLIERASDANLAQNLRSALRAHGILLFKQNMWLGLGHANFSWGQFINASQVARSEIANSSHNIIIDFLAKMGLIGTSLFIVSLLYWFIPALNQAWNNKFKYTTTSITSENKTILANALASIYCISIIGSLMSHAMLEFPENYLYMIIPAGIAIGYSSINYITKLSESKFLMGILLLLTTAYITIVSLDYKELRNDKNEKLNYKSLILYPYSDIDFTHVFKLKDFDHSLASFHLTLFENSTHLLVSSGSMRNYILLLAYMGETDKALKYLDNMTNFVNIASPNNYIKNIYDDTQSKYFQAEKDMKIFAKKLKQKYSFL